MENIQTAIFVAVAAVVMAPIVYLGGPILPNYAAATWQTTVTTQLAAGGVNALTRLVTDPDKPINILAVGSSIAFANPFAAEAVGNLIEFDKEVEQFTWNTDVVDWSIKVAIGGSVGTGINKSIGNHLGSPAKVRNVDRAVEEGVKHAANIAGAAISSTLSK